MSQLLKRLDHAVFRLEKALCLGLLAAMSLVVFLDVVHRLASTAGPLDRLCEKLLPPSAAPAVSLLIGLSVWFALVYAALRTAKVKQNPPPARAAAYAAGLTALSYGAVKLLLVVAPNGLIWSQVFALSGMLWVGFLGASIATYEKAHLTLEIVEFLWKGKVKAHIGRGGALAAAVFCALLSWLCLLMVQFHYEAWRESEGIAGVFDAFAAPKFAVYAILPVAFLVMALRWLGRAVGPTEEEKAPDLKPVMSASEGGQK
jgi:TRAP-type C4-dicarboxylate transport system permease small subunit